MSNYIARTAALFLIWCADPSYSWAEPTTEHLCERLNVTVRSNEHLDTSIYCEGAQSAIKFLASQGLDKTIDITIEIVGEIADHVNRSAAGCYLEEEARVLVLHYSDFEKFRNWFRVPIDLSLYKSLVTHEVAHAVGSCNFKIPKPSVQAKEYIAYVTQFSTMDTAQRESVLSRFPGSGFETDLEMNTTIYLFDPMRFGVQSYRHFLKPGNGREYLHKVLSGKALAD